MAFIRNFCECLISCEYLVNKTERLDRCIEELASKEIHVDKVENFPFLLKFRPI